MPTDHEAESGPPPAGAPGPSSDTAGDTAGDAAANANASSPGEFRPGAGNADAADAGPEAAPEWSRPAGDGPEISDPEASEMPSVQPAPELQIAGLQDQLAAAVRDLQYKEAELQNLRRRHAEERAANLRYRDEELLRELLPALEGLQLALQTEVGGSGDSWAPASSWPSAKCCGGWNSAASASSTRPSASLSTPTNTMAWAPNRATGWSRTASPAPSAPATACTTACCKPPK